MPYARTACVLFILLVLPLAAGRAQSRLPLTATAGDTLTKTVTKTLSVGESDIYEFDHMTAAAVGSPTVADIVPLSSRRLLVNAKGVGETTLFVYDRLGRHALRLAVILPAPDLSPVAARVQAEIGLPDVTVRAVKDTLFLEGGVTSVVALQRASAIAGVYTLKVKNLLTVLPSAESASGPSLAQTYAALLTDNLAGTGITVKVVDDKTIALMGQYASHVAEPEASSGASSSSTRGRKARKTKRAGTGGAGADAPEAADESAPLMDLKEAVSKRNDDGPPLDPLDRLIQSLPPDLRVVDLVNFGSRPTRQILVHAKIIDINRNATKSLGVSWGALQGAAARGGASYTLAPQPILFGQLSGQEANVNGYGFTGGGGLNRVFPLAAQLDALITENKARVLSEPSLMVLDGSEGSILVGGEIPIPVAQSSSGTGGSSASVTIEYKPYGVRLLVSAALVGDGMVQMTVTPEVSDLNYGAAVQISGFVVPSLTVRRATSTLQMADGETLVIGGLYSSTASREVERIPLLSQIPVLGEFFKHTVTRKEENELLILIQPEIVTPQTAGAHPPTPGSVENLPIARPNVRRGDFDKDFPELQQGGGDRDKPRPPVNLPPLNPAAAYVPGAEIPGGEIMRVLIADSQTGRREQIRAALAMTERSKSSARRGTVRRPCSGHMLSSLTSCCWLPTYPCRTGLPRRSCWPVRGCRCKASWSPRTRILTACAGRCGRARASISCGRVPTPTCARPCARSTTMACAGVLLISPPPPTRRPGHGYSP